MNSRLVCQRIVRDFINKYEWALLSEDELINLVLDSTQPESSQTELEKLTKQHYSRALYEACQQDEDMDRRNRAYREVFRYLFRAAYNRWPDLAEVVSQRAIVLVYEQIGRCYNPTTFLAFALNKLRQACTDELRSRDKGLFLEELTEETISQLNPEGGPAASQSAFDQAEALQILLEAIGSLPERKQKVIVLKFFDGLSDEEISARLQITAGYVRVLRYRALKQLRDSEQLKVYFKDD